MARRTPISAGNWKMNLTNEAADDLCHALLLPDDSAIHHVEGVQVVVAPAFLQNPKRKSPLAAGLFVESCLRSYLIFDSL